MVSARSLSVKVRLIHVSEVMDLGCKDKVTRKLISTGSFPANVT